MGPEFLLLLLFLILMTMMIYESAAESKIRHAFSISNFFRFYTIVSFISGILNYVDEATLEPILRVPTAIVYGLTWPLHAAVWSLVTFF